MPAPANLRQVYCSRMPEYHQESVTPVGSDHRSDEDLLEEISRGSRESFSELVRRHLERFHRTAYRILRGQAEAEDVVQEAFVRLWEHPHIWKAGKQAKFTTWFYRIVSNLCIDYQRRKKPLLLDTLPEMACKEPEQPDESLSRLASAMTRLPERQRLALVLCFQEGLSVNQAAEILTVSPKALESLLMRGKKNLARFMMATPILEENGETR